MVVQAFECAEEQLAFPLPSGRGDTSARLPREPAGVHARTIFSRPVATDRVALRVSTTNALASTMNW
jgi:hypothetical protein